ncbi:DUF4145 domain-containing protein [Streptomyces sp. NPDC008265]|uniref:DUF4145 domain-containing protein n=1 Tax=Streptomyces sp. NPDC008265 TaxID=3364824 RepID=UPI0036E60D34
MPGHSHVTHYHGPQNNQSNVSDPTAHREMVCGHCGQHAVAAVIATRPGSDTFWLNCPSCGGGTVISGGQQHPGPKVGGEVAGLPLEVEEAYNEARACAGINAFTATEMMCRKILMHIAVDKGAEPGKSFAFYLSYLADQGYVTPPMKGWVNVIRSHGNIAVHEIPPSDESRALGTLIFTEQLLRLVYLMEHLAAKYTTGP